MSSGLQGRDLRRDLGQVKPAQLQRQRAAFLAAAGPMPTRRRLVAALALAATAATAAVVATVWVSMRDGERPIGFWIGTAAQPGREGLDVVAAANLPMRFDDGSRVTWRGGSRGRVIKSSARTVVIALTHGRLHAEVIALSKSEIGWSFEAEGHQFRVTGTKLDLAVADARIELEVSEGEVVVVGPAAIEGVPVKAGFGATVSAGHVVKHQLVAAEAQPPEPAVVAPTPIGPRQEGRSGSSPRREGGKAPGWKQLAGAKQFTASLAAAQALGLDHLARELGADDLALLAATARFARDPEPAKLVLAALVRRFPRHPEAKLAPFFLGRIAQELENDPASAARHFRRYVAQRGATGVLVEEARGRLIEVLRAAGKDRDAEAAASEYLRLYPNGPYAALARSLVGTEPR